MKKIFPLAMLCASLVSQNAMASDVKTGFGQSDFCDFSTKMSQLEGNRWKRSLRHNPFAERKGGMKRIVSTGDFALGPANSFGTLDGPDGTEWFYTANYDIDDEKGYTAAHMKIYDSQNNLIATIDDNLSLGEHQTGINQVTIDPNVTRKFFNIDDKYEVILFIHATTDDYQGYCYQHVFQLAMDQTEPLLTVPGREVLIADLSTDKWSEKKQMVMMRESITEDNEYFVYFDIYDRATWGSSQAPVLLHTFTMDYTFLAGSGNNAFPITVQNVGGKAQYALSYYEKPYFDPEIPMWEEPVVTPDNTFIIDIYRQEDLPGDAAVEAKPYKTVRIPMETEEGFVFSFPGLGSFLGNGDFAVDLFGDEPHFIVTYDNYVNASDEFVSSVYVYDQDGKKVMTIAEGVTDYMELPHIDGQPKQFCLTDFTTEELLFINLPSGEVSARLPFFYEGRILSTSLDRISVGNSYNYVISCSNGEEDIQGNIYHPIGYFNADGTVNHWDLVNLGPDVLMAQPAIIGPWLNPFLFDGDSDIDYMFLVKLPAEATGSTKSEERLWVLNAQGQKHAEFGPDEILGQLNSIAVLNPQTNDPSLSVSYYDWRSGEYVINFNTLPLDGKLSGSGTASDPFLIAKPGDLLSLAHQPSACFKLVNDIDCEGHPMNSCKVEFSGTLDGDGHTIKNFVLHGAGLVEGIVGGAVVKDLNFSKPVVTPDGVNAGIVAGSARYDGEHAPLVTNVHISAPVVESEDYDGVFGTMVGELSTGAKVSGCSVSEAEISLPQSVVGGLVGQVRASGADVEAVMFNGDMSAAVAGGIVGMVSAVTLNNAHVNANITGSQSAGGVVGEVDEYMSKRGTFKNCIVEGTLRSTNQKDASVGGIAGYVIAGDNTCLVNNIVAAKEIAMAENVEKRSAHRVAGHTCADEPGLVIWDDPWWDNFEGDPYEHQDLWPREEVKPDAGFIGNFALEWLAPVNGDESMAASDSSVEGKTLAVADYTQEFLATRQFAFGESVESPWKVVDNGFALWFEDGSFAGIEQPTVAERMIVKNGLILANGKIVVFNIAGVKVAEAQNQLPTQQLPTGIYVATCGGKSIKFVVK